jgi:hypothetical protein
LSAAQRDMAERRIKMVRIETALLNYSGYLELRG